MLLNRDLTVYQKYIWMHNIHVLKNALKNKKDVIHMTELPYQTGEMHMYNVLPQCQFLLCI